MAVNHVVAGWMALLHGNTLLFMVLLGLAAIDTVYGTARALLERRFQSAMFRQVLVKVMTELALPMVVALLALANAMFVPLIPIALWAGIIAEGSSVLEQLGGKKNGKTAATVLKLLEGLVPAVLRGHMGDTSTASNTEPAKKE